jgi:RNA polymerase-binding protein DksA
MPKVKKSKKRRSTSSRKKTKSKVKKTTVKAKKKTVERKKVVKRKVKRKITTTQESKVQRATGYTKDELEHFKEILLRKRQEILETLEAHRQALIEATTREDKSIASPYSIHMEYGTDTEEREKTMFFIAREEKMLNYIDAALVRIERGNYGVCISCGQLIDKRRLEAVPHTQLCIPCKMKQKKAI